ncbi:hypothetical protein BS47DRAFT_1350563 [Hydnum rufescens UP504]|uniref:SURF1-like protein n=1 Tax=Hydnum rufescens UP504 TaxID=1448309 RepID=A0A9P6ALV6_9AGAM|nr:hypothetical protein BS47DRAFT_1350563 [Hydnum rufescens UP504]
MAKRVTRLGLLFRRDIHSSPLKQGYGWHHDHHPHYSGPEGKRENRFLAKLPIFFLGCMPIVCAGLGTWQIQRLQWKVNLIEDLHDKLSRDPMSLPRNVHLSSIPSFEYRKVRIFGTWDHAHSVLLGPRTRDNVIGYHIITPLRRGDGASTVLVDRGFVSRDLVKNDPSIFAKGSGSNAIVEVVGLLRQSQTRNRFTPDNNVEKGEWYWADVDALAQHAGGPHVGVQPVLIEAIFDGNSGEASERVAAGVPVGRVPNVELRNMHATYAITWYSLSAATGVMFYYLLKTSRQRRANGLATQIFQRNSSS